MCTAINLNCGYNYFGRNLDLDMDYNAKIVITPRDFPISFTCGDIAERHYAIMGSGIVSNNYPLYFEATNEKGVSCAALNFPFFAEYVMGKGKGYLASFEIINYLLSLCDNAYLAAEKIRKFKISALSFSSDFPPTPLHFLLSDKKNSFVLEQTGRGLNIYENKLGVLTNSPEFPMQKIHLSNFSYLSNQPQKNGFSGENEFNNYSNGLGAFSLPGDYSSMSRFVRAAFLRENAVLGDGEEEKVAAFFAVLGSVAVPDGAVVLKNGKTHKTIYSSCANTGKGTYYLKTYNSLDIKKVNLYDFVLDSKELFII